MAKVSKDIDLDTTVVQIKLLIKGNRNIMTINCTYAEVVDFIDFQQRNEAIVSKYDREQFENKYFIFNDIIKKKHIQISVNDVKYMEIPYLFDRDDGDYDLKILSYKA